MKYKCITPDAVCENCGLGFSEHMPDESLPTQWHCQENKQPTEYVAGFMFDGDNVALVVKNRPDWQRGKLNGIGGKIEPGETPIQAMVREFKEETGHETKPYIWGEFAVLRGDGFVVHFFWSVGDHRHLSTVTDEQIVSVPTDTVNVHNAVPNLTWLIPMARSIVWDATNTFQIQESA